ncbi:SDR family NAD(P)-dependent oxidoreductase [Cryptosporangium sp. NPDC048952]|uniref:SDR family NAD(P)-dependent oxidoreductase n=1 Tax=Cryptosporangium sp. NPDC048952 TaxID=3363961 RepID=UPI00372344D9
MSTLAESNDLTGKVAVVTGGTRGLGRAIVQALAEAGADVVVASRKPEAVEAVAAELRASTGTKAVGIACHVAKWDDCDRLVEASLEHFGRLDVLVNNAGMSPLYESLDSISEELFDKTIGVNLKGPFRLAVHAGTHMAAHGGGSIINISTAGSLVSGPGHLPYVCAKAGLNAMTVSLAEAFAPTVRVNTVLPGPFRTDSSKGWAPPEGENVPFVPLGRIGRPEELTPLIVHLASEASSFTTGASIRVDGGVTKAV